MPPNADQRVVVTQAEVADYVARPPFHPGGDVTEYDFGDTEKERNHTFDAVRRCFLGAGLDVGRYGSPVWNPLGALIRPGESVLLKPNLVKENHPRDPEGWRYVLTHGSVIRAVSDYIWKAVGPRGKVVVADAPQTDSSFERIVRVLGLDVVRDFYVDRGLDFRLVDLRREEHESRDSVIVRRRGLDGDPAGYVAFDLGASSEFVGHGGAGRYYGADYDDVAVNDRHCGGRHQYLISGTAIDADVVFSLPKLKTHKKAGITISLKNLVGINGDKNWLPHHTEGPRANGGDEHPEPGVLHRIERAAVPHLRRFSQHVPKMGTWTHRMARQLGRHVFGDTEEVVRSGNWWGNDTVWRMCLDLNKVLLYGNRDGSLRSPTPASRKRHFVLVDGILAGQGRGPMNPDPVAAGLLVFGLNGPSVDAACAYLMGYDPDRLPIVRQAFRCRHFPLAEWRWQDVCLVSDRPEWNGPLAGVADDATFHFEPHFGWKGHIERR